jgi:hypothetical protein
MYKKVIVEYWPSLLKYKVSRLLKSMRRRDGFYPGGGCGQRNGGLRSDVGGVVTS